MNITALCDVLDMPQEALAKITECESRIDFTSLQPELAHMMLPAHWESALARLNRLLGDDEDGMKVLTCQLRCACDAYAKYEALGISNDIFTATMKFFPRFLRDYRNKHGSYRYVWAWWAVRQLSMVEYRIGELEYEMRTENDKPIIDIHIPADADLTTNKLRSSYLAALDFFARHYPNFVGANMVCSSWLLAPSLKYVLPKGSRILQFQKAFTITSMKDSLDFMDWIYGSRDIPIEDLPKETTLQKNLKPYLQNNGTIELASGTLIANPFCPD